MAGAVVQIGGQDFRVDALVLTPVNNTPPPPSSPTRFNFTPSVQRPKTRAESIRDWCSVEKRACGLALAAIASAGCLYSALVVPVVLTQDDNLSSGGEVGLLITALPVGCCSVVVGCVAISKLWSSFS